MLKLSLSILIILGVSALTGCKSTSPTVSGVAGLGASVKASSPIAYYRLEAAKGSSEIGASTYELTGGATVGSGSTGNAALLDGKDGWIKTTQMGGIAKTASLMAWVNLAELPSAAHHYFYVAGESQGGNDFDLQFETDDKLRFFTTGGGALEYAPDPKTLVNQWHMIVVTMDADAPAKVIYWDGQPVAKSQDRSTPNKTAAFAMGNSPVFGGRFLHGGIDEVALWNRVLSADDVAALYKAATTK